MTVEVSDKFVERWASVWIEKYKSEGNIRADAWLVGLLRHHPELRRRVRTAIRQGQRRRQ